MKKLSLLTAIICAIGMIVAIFVHNFMATCGYFCAVTGWAMAYDYIKDNE